MPRKTKLANKVQRTLEHTPRSAGELARVPAVTRPHARRISAPTANRFRRDSHLPGFSGDG